MLNRQKLLCLFLLSTTLVFAGLYLHEKFSFSVSYKVCGVGYVDCDTVAKFEDRNSCETTKQKWGWYCDETDKNNIICKEKNSDISIGYCD